MLVQKHELQTAMWEHMKMTEMLIDVAFPVHFMESNLLRDSNGSII